MNQKKCPKCGEMNPAEAVMCWACYTPLTGGGTAVAAGGGTAAMATSKINDHDDEKKPIPPWQLGVVGVALLLGVGFGISQMMGNGKGDTAVGDVPTTVEYPRPAVEPAPQIPGIDLGPSSGNTTIPSAPVPGLARYAMVSPPNPDLPWGVLAIVPSQQNVSTKAATDLAKYVQRTYATAKWKAMQIYVFSDRQSAQMFSQFQIARRSNVLTPSDYPQLANAWANCLVQYEYNGGKAKVRYPSQAPNGWWNVQR